VRGYRDDGWLVLGAVHHNVVRKAVDDEENLRDAEDLDRLLGYRVPGYPGTGPGPLHLLLHGHTHDGRLDRLPSGLLALSTGSAAVKASARPVEVPNQYQVLTLRHDGLTRYTRAYLPDRKRWTGDNRADLVRDTWIATETVPLPAPAALPHHDRNHPNHGRLPIRSQSHIAVKREREGRGRRDEHWPREFTGQAPVQVDPFLDEVAEITRLRHEGAQVRVHPSPVAGRSYLVVTRRDPSGPVERRPVGAVPGTVDQKVLDTFEKEVHTPNRSLDRHLRSRLVYGGEPPPRTAEQVSCGVVLHSLAEYGESSIGCSVASASA
jgi:hypothetical protein